MRRELRCSGKSDYIQYICLYVYVKLPSIHADRYPVTIYIMLQFSSEINGIHVYTMVRSNEESQVRTIA